MDKTKTNEIKNNRTEIDLVELAAVFLKHWKTIVASTILLALIFGLVSRITYVPEYEATAEMYVFSKSTSITSLADIQVGSSLTSDYEYVISGRTVLTNVINNLDLGCTYEELKKQVTVENPTDTRVIKITVNDTDLDQAREIADEIVNVSSAYIADNMDQSQPKIIQKAYAANEAVNNNILKNTLLGALLGLLLAAAVITVGFLLDDTVSDAEEMENRTGLKVLASLPMEEVSEYDGRDDKKNKKTRGKRAV